MAVQLSTTVRNAMANAIESTIGTAPTLEIRTGSPPATCATADSGTVLATMTLPSDWLAAASSGAVAVNGAWSDTSADATGTAGHFRIKVSGTCHVQGTCGAGSGDLSLVTTSITATQPVEITGGSITVGGA
jgi:hypothetical protein